MTSHLRLIDMQKDLTELEDDLLNLCRNREKNAGLYQAELDQANHNNLVKSIQKSLVAYSDLAEAKYKLSQYRDPETVMYTSLLDL